MIKFSVLGSGSAGNAVLIEAHHDGNKKQKTRLLVDAGLSSKQLCLRMEALGIRPEDLDGILLTHEHGDHIKGLRVFVKKYRTPVFATQMTREMVREKIAEAASIVSWQIFETTQSFQIGGIEISGFPVPHDAVDPCGFFLTAGNSTMGLATDFGYATLAVLNGLRGSQSLFVEANYDEALLEKDLKRPWATKQRIASRHGHLSNKQVVALLNDLKAEGLSRVVLGHLSSDCNCPKLLSGVIADQVGLECHVSTQNESTPWVWCGEEPKQAAGFLPGLF